MSVLVVSAGSSRMGMGHVMRSAAVVEELVARGHPVEVRLAGSVPAWARDRFAGARVNPIDDLALEGSGPLLVDLPTALIDELDLPEPDRRPCLVLDDEGGRRHVSIVSSAHPNADRLAWDLADTTRTLFGPLYVPVRRAIRERRADPVTGIERILVVLGACDVAGRAVGLADAAATRAASVRVVSTEPGGAHEVIEPGVELAPHIAGADLVVCTASTVMLESWCLGRPTAVIAAVAGQEPYRDWGVAAGAAIDLDADGDPAATLASLDDARAAAMGRAGRRLVDGGGVRRLVDALDGAEAGRSW